MTKVTSAIIVGGGIGGAAIALSLAFSLGRTLSRRWIVSVWTMLPASVRCLPITLP